jgi:hypothetical protein
MFNPFKKKPTPPSAPRKKLIELRVTLRNRTTYYFQVRDNSKTCLTAFYDFYKWFFFRESSDKFAFKSLHGITIFLKRDIETIEILEI